jgi:hypothetical protein
MLSEISEGRRVKPPSEIYRPGDLLTYTVQSEAFLINIRCFRDNVLPLSFIYRVRFVWQDTSYHISKVKSNFCMSQI